MVIDFSYVDKDGKRRRYRRDARVQRLATARAEAERLIDLAAKTGSPVARSKAPTFAAFVQDVYRPVFMPRLRPGTRDRYEDLFRQTVLTHFGRKRVDQIDWVGLQRFAAELRGRDVDPRGAGNLVRSVVRAAVEADVLAEFPKLPTFKQSAKLPEAPSVDEVDVLLKTTRGWLRTAIGLAVIGGLRSGEVRALRVADVDFKASVLRVRHAVSGSEIEAPKGGRERLVPMAPELVELLSEAVKNKLPQATIVVTRTGRTPKRQHVLSALNRAQDRAKLPRRSFHLLRHYFCSRLLQVGASIEAVRMLAGHERLSTTARYVHAVTADMTSAISRMSGNQVETSEKAVR